MFWATSPILHSEDKTPTDSDGYKKVPLVGPNGKVVYVPVKVEDSQPAAKASSSSSGGNEYNPREIDPNKTSSLSGKAYGGADVALAKSNAADEFHEQANFISKSYFNNNGTASNQASRDFDTKASYPTTGTDAYSHAAPGLDKSYDAGTTDATLNKPAQFTAGTSEYQGRTANLGGHKVDTFTSSLNGKAYNGPEVVLAQRSLTKLNQGLMQVKDLPNRPLTIDEVRDLINHGIMPSSQTPPPSAEKLLTDPENRPSDPEEKPGDLEDKPERPPAPPPPDTSDEDLPAPGAIAAQHQPPEPPPENSEPLPK